MSMPTDCRYTKEHEWARLEGKGILVVGVTEYAAEKLGDIVYVELPKEGDDIKKDETFGFVESTKSVSDLFAPASGAVVEVNETLVDSPEIINEDPWDEGWFIKIHMTDPTELDKLMSAAEYEEYVGDLD